MIKNLSSKERRIEQFKDYMANYQIEIELLEQRKKAIDLEIETLKEIQKYNLQMISKLENDL